jgi:phage shock protein PspC (stress-responsive transcriptional regulator)
LGNSPGLRRSHEDRWIGGVCAGIAEWLDVPVHHLRLLYFLASILSTAFPGTLVYLLLWIFIPEAEHETGDDDGYDDLEASHLSRSLALWLAAPLGILGAHRFYAGRFVTGAAMLLTGGGLGVWWLIDLVMIATGKFRDSEGYRLLYWEAAEPDPDAFRDVYLARREATNPYPTDTGSV